VKNMMNSRVKKMMTMMLAVGFLAFTSMTIANQGAHGDFVNKQYSITGSWSLTQQGDDWVVTLSDDFKTKSGPDLKIFLSPKSISKVTGKTATDGSVLVSALKKNKGGQQYVLPSGINPADFKSLLIHCEKFSVLWGGSDIS